MKASATYKRISAAAVMAVLATGVTAWGGEEHSADRPQDAGATSMITTYVGPSSQIGTFSGKLVCLRCDLATGPKHQELCEKEGHRHVLSMDRGAMIHPLLAGTPAVLEEINSGTLHGKQVEVHGKHYPSTAMILVDSIRAESEADGP